VTPEHQLPDAALVRHDVGVPSNGSRLDVERAPEIRTCTDPIFVLTSARSGSTLLRRIIDAHPAVYSPAETNIAQVFHTVYLAVASSSSWQDGDGWKPHAINVCHLVAGAILDHAAANGGKTRWCDKSLPTIDYADIVHEVYPRARYVCLYRNCRDFIASALEACPWGLAGFGFDPYARDHPGNTMGAWAGFPVQGSGGGVLQWTVIAVCSVGALAPSFTVGDWLRLRRQVRDRLVFARVLLRERLRGGPDVKEMTEALGGEPYWQELAERLQLHGPRRTWREGRWVLMEHVSRGTDSQVLVVSASCEGTSPLWLRVAVLSSTGTAVETESLWDSIAARAEETAELAEPRQRAASPSPAASSSAIK